MARVGRYGPYLQRGEDRVSIPEDLAPDELTSSGPRSSSRPRRPTGCSGRTRRPGSRCWCSAGRFGPYVQLGEVVDGGPKPRTASLFASMTPATITLEQALELLSIPRVVGADPATGEEIVAHNGRFGPYLKKGTDTRSLRHRGADPDITVDEALGALRPAQDPPGPGRRRPLRELGAGPRHRRADGGARTAASGPT